MNNSVAEGLPKPQLGGDGSLKASPAVGSAGRPRPANSTVSDSEAFTFREVTYGPAPRPIMKWRPGRNQILFNHGRQIYLLEADGSGMRLLVDIGATLPADRRWPTWRLPQASFDVSPDGAFIVYDTFEYWPLPENDFTYKIGLLHIDSGRRQSFTSGERGPRGGSFIRRDFNDTFPAWSADGAQVAFVQTRVAHPDRLVVSRIDRSRQDVFVIGLPFGANGDRR